MNNPALPADSNPVEKFPHVIKRITMMWATPELDFYINRLMTDSRDGQRRGFPVEVTAELLFLAELNKLVRAIDVARKLKIPLREAYQKIDKQDRGSQLGDRSDPLAGRDHYAREDKEFQAIPRPPERNAKEAGRESASSSGTGGFASFMGKLLFFLMALFLAYQYLLPLFLKK